MFNGKMTKLDWFKKMEELVVKAAMPVKTKEEKKDENGEIILVEKEIFILTEEDKTGLLEFIERETSLLNKKQSTGIEQREKKHEEILDIVLDVLKEQDKPLTIGELLEDERLQTYTKKNSKGMEETEKMSPQRLSAFLKKLKDQGLVIRTEEKKKAYFEAAIPEAEKAEDETKQGKIEMKAETEPEKIETEETLSENEQQEE